MSQPQGLPSAPTASLCQAPADALCFQVGSQLHRAWVTQGPGLLGQVGPWGFFASAEPLPPPFLGPGLAQVLSYGFGV